MIALETLQPKTLISVNVFTTSLLRIKLNYMALIYRSVTEQSECRSDPYISHPHAPFPSDTVHRPAVATYLSSVAIYVRIRAVLAHAFLHKLCASGDF